MSEDRPPIRRPGAKVIWRTRIAGKILLLGGRRAVVANPDEPPLVISWDEEGTISEAMIKP